MKLKDLEIEFSVVTVVAFGTDPIARTFAVVVPIMSNSVAVKEGEMLCLESTVNKGDESEGRVVENRRGQGRESSEGQSECDDCG